MEWAFLFPVRCGISLAIYADFSATAAKPHLAKLISARGVPVAFADTQAGATRRFYAAAQVRSLSQIRQVVGQEMGTEVPPPPKLNSAPVMMQICSRRFASALAALCASELQSRRDQVIPTAAKLQDALQVRQKLVFVRDLKVLYDVAGTTVPVDESVLAQPDRFVCCGVTTRQELRGRLSRGIAGLLVQEPPTLRVLTDSIYRMLDCASGRELGEYLATRGV